MLHTKNQIDLEIEIEPPVTQFRYWFSTKKNKTE